MRLTSLSVAGVMAAAITLGLAGTATANRGNDAETIRVQDDCDPVTFNEAQVPGGCLGDGDTTFQELIDTLIAEGAHDKWRFHPDHTHIDRGEALIAHNVGGEFHTFSEVSTFNRAGCVQPINDVLGLGPAPASCATEFVPTLLPQGAKVRVDDLSRGRHKFMCLIHPWMRTVVEVRR